MKRTFFNKKANLALVTTLIVTMVFLAVMIPVGLMLWQGITGSINSTGWSTEAQQTLTSLNQNIGMGFTLTAIVPIIVIAGGIITLLLAFFKQG